MHIYTYVRLSCVHIKPLKVELVCAGVSLCSELVLGTHTSVVHFKVEVKNSYVLACHCMGIELVLGTHTSVVHNSSHLRCPELICIACHSVCSELVLGAHALQAT